MQAKGILPDLLTRRNTIRTTKEYLAKERQGKIIGGLFSSPKSVKAPVVAPVAPAAPLPEVSAEVEDEAKKRAKRRKGRAETFITGELVPETTKKTLLG